MHPVGPLRVLYEDNHLLAVAKPPGIPTQGAARGKASLVSQAKDYLRRKYRKPGNAYLGVVSRLDATTSGIVIFARTSKAAARLSEEFRQRRVEKLYWALVDGCIEPSKAEWTDWMAKDERRQRMMVVPQVKAGAQEARLSYRRRKQFAGITWVEILLETGRKHQIRVQFAARKHPVVGDTKYGSQHPFAGGIALHCRRLAILHPVKKTLLEFIAPVPHAWQKFKIQ
ncbi:MAG: RluA family pseudouridine synthase [Pirellulales bacterium]|nr:RluA family pseudouridine synthase [Pirellulales bacterium]